MSLFLDMMFREGSFEGMSGDSIQMMRNDPQKKKTRGRRIEMDLNEMQDQLQRKAEELQRAEAESVRLRQRLKASAVCGAH
eukprot:XP_001695482.1 predicted protein [Chlamydomonas reinhardtii]